MKTSRTTIEIDGIQIELTRKAIKNVYLRIGNPDGQVRMSAPAKMADRDVVRFVHEHMDWIRQRQARMAALPQRQSYQYQSGEMHPVFGQRCRLVVIEGAGRAGVQVLEGGVLEMRVRAGTDAEKRGRVLDAWYRTQLQTRIPDLIARWEPVMGVSVDEWGVKKMRTRWGTCNIRAKRIWLNLELAKRPERCLDYVVVHEMNHLLERGHTKRYYGLMDRWMPDWKRWRKALNDQAIEPE